MSHLKSPELYFFDPSNDNDKVISNFLFNQPEHLFLQSKKGWTILGLKLNNEILAQVSFHVEKNKARSPLRAPFGSLQVSSKINFEHLEFFISQIEKYLVKRNVTSVFIRDCPLNYRVEDSALLYKILVLRGYDVHEQLTSIIPVDRNDFKTKIKLSQRQKLRKCESKFKFSQLGISQLLRVYQFIEQSRNQIDQLLSMSVVQLRKTVKTFPSNFLLFEVTDGSVTAAAAVVIAVNEEILYTFYYAHDRQFNKISPVVFLLSGIYSYAQANGYKMIDLGTSMNGDKIYKPLLHFKESVGGKVSPKFLYEKNLE